MHETLAATANILDDVVNEHLPFWLGDIVRDDKISDSPQGFTALPALAAALGLATFMIARISMLIARLTLSLVQQSLC